MKRRGVFSTPWGRGRRYERGFAQFLFAAGAGIADIVSGASKAVGAGAQSGAIKDATAEQEARVEGKTKEQAELDAINARLEATTAALRDGKSTAEATAAGQAAYDAAMATVGEGGAQQETEKAFARAQETIRETTGQAVDVLGQTAAAQEAALREGTTSAVGAIGEGLSEQERLVREGTTGAVGALTGAEGRAREDVGAGLAGLAGTLGAGQEAAAGALSQGLAGAGEALAPAIGLQGLAAGATQPIDAFDVTGARSRAGEMLDQPGGLFANFEADPGFQFRRQQGEQAIDRSASARGGRLSGRSLKEMASFNSGLAAQEFQNFAQRRQAELGAAMGIDQQTLAGLLNQAGRSDSAQQQAIQNQLSLAGIGFGAGSQLAGLTAQSGQSLANLFSGTAQQLGGAQFGMGQFLANMGMGTGGNIAQLLAGQGNTLGSAAFGAGGQLAGLFQGLGTNLSGAAGQQGSSIARLLAWMGTNLGNLQVGENQQQIQLMQMLGQLGMQGAGAAGMSEGAIAESTEGMANRLTQLASSTGGG